MIQENNSGNRLLGKYRGIVLKHLPHGRCKIYVPSVYSDTFLNDPDNLPSAEQKTPLFAGTNKGNGVFSYPNLSSIVWCEFINGDANYPIFEAATLGGENAFGQYELIKNKHEEVSDRHMITSGKTHMLWYENGKLSGIVEDPIRTECSVDYDQFELEANNTSVENKYSYSISNDILNKIAKNEISNINCQYVLDNNGGTHGKLSTSTHWFNIIKADDNSVAKTTGTISVDNWNIMSNNGIIDIGTLSIQNLHVVNTEEQSNSMSTVDIKNRMKMNVPGVFERTLKTEIKNNGQYRENEYVVNDSSTNIQSHRHYEDISANTIIEGNIDIKNNISKKAVPPSKDYYINNSTINLVNGLYKQQNGCDSLFSKYNEHIISSELCEKEKPTRSSTALKDEQTEFKLLHGAKSNTEITYLSALNQTKDGEILNHELTNTYFSSTDGKNQILTQVYINDTNPQKLNGTIKKNIKNSIDFDIDGQHKIDVVYNTNTNINGASNEVNNRTTIDLENKPDATMLFQTIGKTMSNGSPIIDTKYSNIINTTTSIAAIQIVDNISKIECVDNKNAKNGKIEIRVTGKTSGTSCTIIMDAQGKMTITTSDSLAITTTNKVDVTSPTVTVNGTTTINGDTTVNGTLHVTGATTIDPDATIGGKSFLSHSHTGNMGSPTSPPI